jgi:hypothetical protein
MLIGINPPGARRTPPKLRPNDRLALGSETLGRRVASSRGRPKRALVESTTARYSPAGVVGRATYPGLNRRRLSGRVLSIAVHAEPLDFRPSSPCGSGLLSLMSD